MHPYAPPAPPAHTPHSLSCQSNVNRRLSANLAIMDRCALRTAIDQSYCIWHRFYKNNRATIILLRSRGPCHHPLSDKSNTPVPFRSSDRLISAQSSLTIPPTLSVDSEPDTFWTGRTHLAYYAFRKNTKQLRRVKKHLLHIALSPAKKNPLKRFRHKKSRTKLFKFHCLPCCLCRSKTITHRSFEPNNLCREFWVFENEDQSNETILYSI